MRRIKEVLFCDQDRNLERKRIKLGEVGGKYYFLLPHFFVSNKKPGRIAGFFFSFELFRNDNYV